MAWGQNSGGYNRGGGNRGGGGGNYRRGGSGGSNWNRGGGGNYRRGGGGRASSGGNSSMVRITGLFPGKRDGVFSGTVSVADLADFATMLKGEFNKEGAVRFVLYENDQGNGPVFSLCAFGVSEDENDRGGNRRPSRIADPEAAEQSSGGDEPRASTNPFEDD